MDSQKLKNEVSNKNIQALAVSNKDLSKMVYDQEARLRKLEDQLTKVQVAHQQTLQEIQALRGMALTAGFGGGPTA